MAGRSNAGKSSAINIIVNRRQFALFIKWASGYSDIGVQLRVSVYNLRPTNRSFAPVSGAPYLQEYRRGLVAAAGK